jgi:hypothetical protein
MGGKLDELVPSVEFHVLGGVAIGGLRVVVRVVVRAVVIGGLAVVRLVVLNGLICSDSFNDSSFSLRAISNEN